MSNLSLDKQYTELTKAKCFFPIKGRENLYVNFEHIFLWTFPDFVDKSLIRLEVKTIIAVR